MSFFASGTGWAALGGLGGNIIGGLISANGTRNAQNDANNAAAAQAAAQNKLLWDQYLVSRGINPGNIPGISGGTVNTVLPIGANINGVPAEQYILNALGAKNQPPVNTNDPGVYAAEDNIKAFFAAHPEVKQEIVDNMAGSDDTRTPEQWLHDHVTQTEATNQPDGSGTFTTYLRNFATQAQKASPAAQPGAGATEQINKALPQNVLDAQNAALGAVGKIYNGDYLKQENAALNPITDARTALAALQAQKNTEMRTNAGNVLNTQLGGLDALLNTRNTSTDNILKTTLAGLDPVMAARQASAQGIYSAGASGLAGVRGAQTTGANNIYGAEMTNANSYADAVNQAVAQTMARNRASRALRGFNGDSSTDALTNARTLASGYQQSAGARGQAGINLQGRLSDAAVGEQQGLLGYGTQRASQLGDASIQDQLARLLANQTAATSRGGSAEQDALGRLGANTNYATTLSGILDSNAAAAMQQAALQNAADRASLTGNDIARQLAGVNTASNIYGNTLNLTNQASTSKYADLNALMQSLGFLKQQAPATPGGVQPNVGSVLNNGQILGSGLSSIGGAIQNQLTTQQLLALLNRTPPGGGGSGSGGGGTGTGGGGGGEGFFG